MAQRITPLRYRKLVRIFEKDGWYLVRQRDDHLIFKKEGFSRKVVIPRYKTVPIFIIKKNMETAEMSSEHYFSAFKENLR